MTPEKRTYSGPSSLCVTFSEPPFSDAPLSDAAVPFSASSRGLW